MKYKTRKIWSTEYYKAPDRPVGVPRGFLVFLFFTIIFQTAAFGQTVFDLPSPGTSVERSLGKSEKHVYQIRLEKGRFAQVRVEQLGVGLHLSAFDSAGNLILRSDSRDRLLGLEAVSVVASQAGVYRFEVVANRAVNGKYRIILAALRESTPADNDLLETEQIFMAAMRLASGGSFKSRSASLEKYSQAAAGFQKHNDLARSAIALNQLGHTQNLLGQKRAALESFQKSLGHFREVKDLRGESAALRFMGVWHNLAGDRERAIEFLSQSLEIAGKIRNTDGEASALQRLADVYSQLGETEKALGLYDQALKLRESDEEQGINTNYLLLNRVGDLHAQQKNWQKALDVYLQAVEANNKRGGNNFPINSFWRVGRMYVRLGDTNKALKFLNDGKQREEQIRDPQRLGNILLGLGETYYALGEKQKALEFFREGAATFRTIFNKTGEAFALFSAARAEQDLGNLDSAQREIETVLNLVETLRSRLNNLEFRTSYFATTEDYYDFYLELLWNQHLKNPQGSFDKQAWATTERARARTLAEMLYEAKVDIRKGVASELLDRELVLRTELNEKAELHLQLTLERNSADVVETTRVGKEIENLSTDLASIQTKIRQASPRYAALVQPGAPSLRDVQSSLDADTLILEYKLGTERSFLWLVGRDSLEQFELPARAEIEVLARRFYEQISSRKPEAQLEAGKISENLGRIVLGRVSGKIKNKRLLVIADGPLQLVPFASLTLPDSVLRDATAPKRSEISNFKFEMPKSRFLIETNEIINLPSASILPLLRHNSPVRPRDQKTLAIFADAIFAADDGRVSSRTAFPARQADFKSNVPDSRLRMARLPFSRREANAIMAIAPAAETFAALDFAANRETVLKTDLSQFRIVHFATHRRFSLVF